MVLASCTSKRYLHTFPNQLCEIYLDVDNTLCRYYIRPGHYLEIPASRLHAGSGEMQPNRVYVLGSKGQQALPADMQVAVLLAAEVLAYA